VSPSVLDRILTRESDYGTDRQHLENVKFAVHAQGHQVVCDQPLDNGGTDAGITPEFLLASLGTCAGFYAA